MSGRERDGMRFISQVASCLSRSSSDPWNRMPVTPVPSTLRSFLSLVVSLVPPSLVHSVRRNDRRERRRAEGTVVTRGTGKDTSKRSSLRSSPKDRMFTRVFPPHILLLSCRDPRSGGPSGRLTTRGEGEGYEGYVARWRRTVCLTPCHFFPTACRSLSRFVSLCSLPFPRHPHAFHLSNSWSTAYDSLLTSLYPFA